MTDFPITWMADAFRANGLPVKEVRGWRTRTATGFFDPRGVIFHHTASNPARGSAPALSTVTFGRSDLSGPLCNVLVGRDGTVYLIAAGRANHAGLGGPWRNIPKDSGNGYLIGVEVENNGTGEKWTTELLETCDLVFATLLIGLRRRSRMLGGHREWAPHRKIDPAPVDMNARRIAVQRKIQELRRGRKVANRATAPPVVPPEATTGTKPEEPGPEPTDKLGEYVVVRGDTLWAIARDHSMSVAELKQINGLPSNLISVGQRLKVVLG